MPKTHTLQSRHSQVLGPMQSDSWACMVNKVLDLRLELISNCFLINDIFYSPQYSVSKHSMVFQINIFIQLCYFIYYFIPKNGTHEILFRNSSIKLILSCNLPPNICTGSAPQLYNLCSYTGFCAQEGPVLGLTISFHFPEILNYVLNKAPYIVILDWVSQLI